MDIVFQSSVTLVKWLERCVTDASKLLLFSTYNNKDTTALWERNLLFIRIIRIELL